MITGSFPPDICGVGDYTSCIMEAANKTKWDLFYSDDWRLLGFFRKISLIDKYDAETIVMQYPTQGYKWSMLPQLICLYYSLLTHKKTAVVLHEFSQRTWKAKLATCFFRFADKIIFTNEYEQEYAHKYWNFPSKKSTVIKILSNIKAATNVKTWNERTIDLAYFGHLRPYKGLEDFFAVASKIHKSMDSIKIAVIGQILPEFETYFNSLLERHNLLDVDLQQNKTVDEVADLLNATKIVFLPFPDGMSERRGSFLAAISNGSLVVSYGGKFVTNDLRKIFVQTDCHNAPECIAQILQASNNKSYAEWQFKNRNYLQNNIPVSWQEIVILYEEFLKSS